MNSQRDQDCRRKVAYVSTLGTTQLHLRNPFIVAGWSIAFPGLGHLLLSKHLIGFLLFTWEIFVNYKACINYVILYSFIGKFQTAKEVLNIRWVLLYLPTYFFAIWDSYRSAVDINHKYILAAREDATVQPFAIGSMEINYLDKRNPANALMWSALMPGAGHLYVHRIITAAFLLSWWIAIVYYSNLLTVVQLTLTGNFEQAKNAVDMHWALNIPSVYFFAMYDAYVNTVENNKLYEWELGKYLRKHYQSKDFDMPIKKETEGDSMYVFSTFEQTKYLELAITGLQMKGIKKENILAVPMDRKAEQRKLFDTLHSSDWLSMLDIPMLLGTLSSVIGAVYGFIFTWGPLIWGLIGFAAGFIFGLTIKLISSRKYISRSKDKKEPEIVVIVKCLEDQADMVKDTLWEHFALGVSKLSLD
jgi:hypothetical protein